VLNKSPWTKKSKNLIVVMTYTCQFCLLISILTEMIKA